MNIRVFDVLSGSRASTRHCQQVCLWRQVKKAGALDASSVESDAEMEEIRRFRKPTVIAVIVIFIAAMIVWPLLMLPAGDFRSEATLLSVALCVSAAAGVPVQQHRHSLRLGYALSRQARSEKVWGAISYWSMQGNDTIQLPRS